MAVGGVLDGEVDVTIEAPEGDGGDAILVVTSARSAP